MSSVRGPSRGLIGLFAAAVIAAAPGQAAAQVLPAPQRSEAWGTVSTVSALVGASTQLLMPRVYYADTEVTVGWKARWHASVLATTMTLMALAFVSEVGVKPEIGSFRPGCGPSNLGVPGCTTFGMPSTHTYTAFASLGHGTAVFLVDSFKWNEGRVSAGSAIGNVGLPLVASILSYAGRVVGTPSYEHGDQALVGAGVGIGLGLVAGGVYSLLQRPECGYGAGVVCW